MDAELKQALVDLESRINGRLDAQETRLNDRIETVRADLVEHIEVSETSLLRAFHTWAQTYEVRARGTSAAVREFDERLGMIEERLNQLERRKGNGKH